nr:hypothetical protein [Tanacetum cinerariifolium]
MKARGTLLMALPNKGQLKFHSYKDTKFLMEAIEKRLQKIISQLEIQDIKTISLDELYNNLKIYEPELTGSSSISQNPQNMAFVSFNSTNSTSNTNEADNTAFGVSTTHFKGNTINSTSVDNLSDDVICAFLASHPNSPQLVREDLEQIDLYDLKEMDLHWEMAMLTIRAISFLKRTCLQSVEERLAHYKKNKVVFKEKINILNLEVKLRDNALVENIKKLEKAEKERDELKLTLEKFQNSSKPLNNLLENHNQKNVKSRSDKGYHAVPPPYTGNYIPPKPDLIFIDEQVKSKSVDVVSNVSSSHVKTVESKHESVDVKNKGVYSTVETKPVRKNNFSPPIIEDWNSNDESEVEFEPKVEVKTVRPSIEKIKFVKSTREKVDKETNAILLIIKIMMVDLFLLEMVKAEFLAKFCDMKGIKREFSVGRTPQQNGVTERKNRTLIEGARTMLVDSKLPTTFWSKVVNTACYVLNRALVIKPHNKTPYKLIRGRPPLIDLMKPFGCPVTILNTKDYLGRFDEKVNEGFFVGYSVVSKAKRVFNKRTRIVEETLNIGFLENAPNVKGNGPDWLFDIDSLTISMNYVSVVAGKQTNGIVGTKDNIVVGLKDSTVDAAKKATEVDKSQVSDNSGQDDQVTKTVEEEVDMNNVVSSYIILDASLTIFLKDHPKDQVIGSIKTHVQTRQMTKINEEHGLISSVQKLRRTNHKDFQNCLFACSLSQMEPKKPVQALKDLNKWAIGTKWVFRNKKDESDVLVKNKARLVAQGHTQEEGIDYDEVFAPVAPRALYETLSTYLMDNGFHKGQIDKTLFMKRHKDDILLVQVYVDDIIFGSTKKELSTEFEELMRNKFQMSSMGELSFFLGLQTTSTLMEPKKALVKDAEAKDVDVYLDRSMIGSLMYLTAFRPDITFVVCVCARDSPFNLESCSDSDYAGASLDRKSTTRGCQFLGKKLISWQCKKQTIVANSTTKAEYVAAASCCGQIVDFLNANPIKCALIVSPTIYTSCIKQFWTSAKIKTVNDDVRLQALVDGKKVIVNEASIRCDLQLNDVECTAYLSNDVIFEGLARMGDEKPSQKLTFYSPQWKFLIHTILQRLCAKTTRKHKPRRKQREDTEVPHSEPQAEEIVPTPSHDPLPSGEDRFQLNELMDICIKLFDRVLSLEQTKTNLATKIDKLNERVKKLEGKKKKRTHGLKRLYKVGLSARVESSEDEGGLGAQEDASKQGRIAEIDANEDLFLIDETAQDQGKIKDQDLFGVHDLDGDEVFVDVTTGENVEQDTTVAESVEEPEKPLKKKDQITLDEEVARKLEAEIKAKIDEEESIAREENEANIVIIEE